MAGASAWRISTEPLLLARETERLVGRVRGGSRKDIRLDIRQGDRTVAVGNRNFPRDERRSDDFGIRGPRMKIVGGHLLQGNRSVGGIGLHFAGSQIFTVD